MRLRSLHSIFLVLGLASLSQGFDYNGTPVGWGVGVTESTTTVNTRISEGWKPLSLDVRSPGSTSTTFLTPYVQNTGSHQLQVKLLVNQTATTINNWRNAGWRIEDIERPTTNVYTALLTKTGTIRAATGWFVNYSASQVTSILGSSRRLLELDSVVINGVRRFNGVYVANTGVYAKGWGWMPGHTLQEILDWAGQNGMRIIDLDPVSTSRYAAVFVKQKPGERYYIATGSWSAITEMQESTGTRIQVANKLEGQTYYAAILVNNSNAQVARIADSLMATSGRGRIGAFVKQTGGSVLVDLRGSRTFYPCSAIKVLIHVAGLAKVPSSELNTYKIDDGSYLSYAASKMMKESNNYYTYELNKEWGYQYINQYGHDYLGTSSNTFIDWHFGDTPPDGEWNALATLKDMASIYEKRHILGSTKLAKYRAWMNTEMNWAIFDSLFNTLKNQVGLTTSQYSDWKSYVRYEFKAGNVGLNGSSTLNQHWVNVGRITLPTRGGQYTALRNYVFGHFVNDSQDGYHKDVTWSHSTNLVREQIIASMNSFK